MAQYDHNLAYECNLAVGSTMDMSLKGHIDSVEGNLETRKTMRHPRVEWDLHTSVGQSCQGPVARMVTQLQF